MPSPRKAADSHSVLVRWMALVDANSAGYVHGGTVMKLCDEVAGLRLDTSTGGITSRRIARTAERGPRWRVALRTARGFTARHPLGF